MFFLFPFSLCSMMICKVHEWTLPLLHWSKNLWLLRGWEPARRDVSVCWMCSGRDWHNYNFPGEVIRMEHPGLRWHTLFVHIYYWYAMTAPPAHTWSRPWTLWRAFPSSAACWSFSLGTGPGMCVAAPWGGVRTSGRSWQNTGWRHQRTRVAPVGTPRGIADNCW